MIDLTPISYKTDSNISIITLHGYLESCYTMSYINQELQKHYYNVESPNLSGHAGKYTDLHNVKYKDWITQIEGIYKKQNPGNKKIIIGHSLGGMLALYMAEHYKLSGIILINPLFDILPISMMMTPIGRYFIKYVPSVKPDIKNNAPIFLYGKISTWNTSEIIKLSKVIKNKITNVQCPILIFNSIKDHRVDGINSKNILKYISSIKNDITYLNNSYHVAPLDNDKELIIEKIIKFIKEVI